MSVRPELSVKIIVEIDSRTEHINTRNSVIYDANGDTLILAQTEPPIESSMLNKEIVVTYVVKEKDKHVRYSFPAVITEFIDQYQPMPEHHVRAIAARRRGDPKPYNIRTRYRVQPSSKSGLNVPIYNKKVNVVDISLGGIKFSYDEHLQLETNKVIKMCLGMAGEVHTIEARIVRIWEKETEFFKTELRFAVAEFLNVSHGFEQELSRKILDIEMEVIR